MAVYKVALTRAALHFSAAQYCWSMLLSFALPEPQSRDLNCAHCSFFVQHVT